MEYDFRALGRGYLLALVVSAAACGPPGVTTGSSGGPLPSPRPASKADAEYRRIEAEIVGELNSARSNPHGFAKNLSLLLPLFNGNVLARPGAPTPIRTNEGAAAVREAIDVLLRQAPVPTVTGSAALSRAGRDLADDQARSGAIGHSGRDGSTPGSRIDRYGHWDVSYSENVDYGQLQKGRDVIVDLLVDDGVRDRGHRRNIFDPSARVVGVACGPHPKYGSMCVIDQVGGFTAR